MLFSSMLNLINFKRELSRNSISCAFSIAQQAATMQLIQSSFIVDLLNLFRKYRFGQTESICGHIPPFHEELCAKGMRKYAPVNLHPCLSLQCIRCPHIYSQSATVDLFYRFEQLTRIPYTYFMYLRSEHISKPHSIESNILPSTQSAYSVVLLEFRIGG